MYSSSNLGNIIIVKGIIFNNSKNNRREIDHAHEHGRPCLLFYSDDEYDYFLTFTSSINNNNRREYYKLSNKDYDYLYSNVKSFSAVGYINLRNIYKKKICGYGTDEIGKIKFSVYKDIMNKFKEYHRGYSFDEVKDKSVIIGGK